MSMEGGVPFAVCVEDRYGHLLEQTQRDQAKSFKAFDQDTSFKDRRRIQGRCVAGRRSPLVRDFIHQFAQRLLR